MRTSESKSYLAVVTAIPRELFPFLRAFQPEPSEPRVGRNTRIGRLRGIPTILLSCGVGRETGGDVLRSVADRFPIRFAYLVGVAGGINPSVRVGDVVIPDEVRSLRLENPFSVERVPLPTDLTRFFQNGVEPFRIRTGGTLVTVDRVFGPEEKRSLDSSGVIAVDMESYFWIRILRTRGIPFLAVRGISDHRDDPVPASLFIRRLGQRQRKIGETAKILVNPRNWLHRWRFRNNLDRAARNGYRVVDRLLELGSPWSESERPLRGGNS